ncbi:DUF3332 family protein [Leptospira sp. 96542]|nr:DUF3332 family protein [Leptospira sp. 96542]
MKKLLKITMVGLLSLGIFANCYGKFGLVKTIYSVNGNINIGNGKVAGFFKSLLMIFPFSFAYWIGGLLDVFIFNLIEFWTNTNPVGMAEYDFDGKLVKEFKEGEQTLTLTYTNWGKELRVDAKTPKGNDTLYFFKDKPERAFRKMGNQYVEIINTRGPILPPPDAKLI